MVVSMAQSLQCSPLSQRFPLPPHAGNSIILLQSQAQRLNVICSSSPSTYGRRRIHLASTAILLLYQLNSSPTDANATELPKALDKYVKRFYDLYQDSSV